MLWKKAYNPTVVSYMVHESRRNNHALQRLEAQKQQCITLIASTKQIIIKFYNIASHSYYTNM